VGEDSFEVIGKFTNEEVVMKQSIAHGATKGLYDSVASKDGNRNIMLYIVLAVIAIIVIAGLYVAFTSMGGVFDSLAGGSGLV